MEWWIVLIIVFGLLVGLFLTGMPVAFAFLFINFLGAFIWMGGEGVLHLVVVAIFPNIGHFALVAGPLFIFLGELLFQTGLAAMMITGLSKWIGRIHGSLSFVAVGSGVIFGMMSGAAVSGVAVLGSTLVPEMRQRGYSKEMSIGPILGAGGLAMIIPPSIVCIILAMLAMQPVGKMLIAGAVPGLILAGLYATYILVRANLQPHLAPLYAPPKVTWGERVKALVVISPLSIIIFLVLGLIFLGVATPTEAAATGVTGAFLLAIAYRQMNWTVFKKAVSESVVVGVMILTILMGSLIFSQLLAYTGTTSALVKIATTVEVHPLVVVVFMQFILIILGCFIDGISILMITVPIYMPIIQALGFDPIWFGIMMLVNIEMGTISPPFGLLNFVMKGIVPDASMTDIVLAGLPFFGMGIIALAIMLFFPEVVTWLPGLMMG